MKCPCLISCAPKVKASSFFLRRARGRASVVPGAQSRIATAIEQMYAFFKMIAFMASGGKVCLRPGSGKQYSLQRAVAQLGSALEWGSRGRGFKSRRPDKFLSHGLTRMKHRLCVVKIQIYPFKSVFICS